MVILRTDLIKCVVLGDDEVGKTSMLLNYATNRFPSKHVPNVFDNYAGYITLAGKEYNLQLIDTVVKGETDEVRRQSYPGTDVFVVCFSVVKPETFENVKQIWLPEIRKHMGEDVPFILVGTQADLRDDDEVVRTLTAKGCRPLKHQELAAASRRLGAACYFECSPVMKKRLRRVVHNAMSAVFCPKDDQIANGCAIL